jgi:DNA-binding transcriptional regulator YhcF (GntR family)
MEPADLVFMAMTPLDQVPPEARSERIKTDIIEAIAAGGIRPDDEIPSWELLAVRYRADPDDVLRALRELQRLGLTGQRDGATRTVLERRTQ